MSTLLPPTLTQSLQALPASSLNSYQDPLLYIGRQAKHIQRNLQVLIDAQSEGLLAGLTDSPQQSISSPSNGSFSPTPDSSRTLTAPSTVPVRQPKRERIGLRAAREGIFKSIYDLLKLREEEREVLTFRVGERKDALKDIDGFSRKQAGLEEAILEIENDRESQRSRELREEEHRLEADIHELENKLSQMKARHRQVTQELSHVENTVESKLSSYKASLSILESDIHKFLASPPVGPQATDQNEQTFYSLNPQRRTLNMAQEYWKEEQSALRRRQGEVDSEIAALEEGGGVWKQVVWEVSGFERRLKTAMRRSVQTRSQILQPSGPSGSKSEEDNVRGILEDLGSTAERVEQHLRLAESKDWRLLVCCIATELEALREARSLLLNAFGVLDESEDEKGKEPRAHSETDGDIDSWADPLGVDNPEPPEDLLRDADAHSHSTGFKSEDDDDEPDPAWLLPEA
ncbi:hypothetical protein P168DRAFT_292166 [Aspergillus campestris IBT 28561]|uniref:Autophagy-related protein Atg28 n=1 Tax=Aspergillus campestris (strain IBT 28561) TaxID=1392248 RepID=A0A2I1CWS5_ASPC2|nr:uncharacterized protein P168DRAFT_292166 [Aspergillus campestris IBT 28561]PKY02055.1 hypothetical protein P168DRAFT_292166 [Aspergillus campestris IBT 28561]